MKLSIIIRAYNAAGVISQAIESVLKQTASPDSYEIVIVDDGSTDNLSEALLDYKDRITLISQKNSGQVRAANVGIQHSKGDYVTLLDADDVLKPEFVEKMIAATGDDADFIYCDYVENTGEEQKIVSLRENIFNCIATAIVFKKAALESVGWYDESIIFAEYDIIVKLQKAGFVGKHVGLPLYVYIRSKTSLTGNKEYLKKAFRQIKDRYGDLPIRKY